MQAFADLFNALDQTTSTNAKVAALTDYFQTAADPDKLWCIALFSGRRPKRAVTTTRLREWAAERAGIPLWLFEETYPIVGDLSETIALILPDATRQTNRTLSDWMDEILRLTPADEDSRKEAVLDAWDCLNTPERFLFNKLLTGGFRVGVSQKLMTRALSRATDTEEAQMAHRLMGHWTPETTTFHDLIHAQETEAEQ